MFIGLLISIVTVTSSSSGVKNVVNSEVSGNGASETHITTVVNGEETKVDSYESGEITVESINGKTIVNSSGAKPTITINNKIIEEDKQEAVENIETNKVQNEIQTQTQNKAMEIKNRIMARISTMFNGFLGLFRKKT